MLTVDLDWRSVAAVLAAFAGLVAVTALVRATPRTFTIIAVATLIAFGLTPLVELIDRHTPVALPRGASVALVLAALALVFVAALALLVPPAVEQARNLQRELPSVVAELGNLPVVGPRLEAADAPATVQHWIEGLPGRLAVDTTPLERAGRSVADGLLVAVATFLLAVGLLVDAPRLVGALRRLVPEPRRPQADRIGRLAYDVVGRYVAGSLSVACVAGVVVLVIGLVLRVPLTPLVALWVMLWNLVPQIGGAAGGIPFVLLGFTRGAGTGLLCAVFFVVYLQLENNVLAPLLVGKAVELSPPATMTAALVGVSAGGVVGGLLAVPLAGAAKAIYLELRR